MGASKTGRRVVVLFQESSYDEGLQLGQDFWDLYGGQLCMEGPIQSQ